MVDQDEGSGVSVLHDTATRSARALLQLISFEQRAFRASFRGLSKLSDGQQLFAGDVLLTDQSLPKLLEEDGDWSLLLKTMLEDGRTVSAYGFRVDSAEIRETRAVSKRRAKESKSRIDELERAAERFTPEGLIKLPWGHLDLPGPEDQSLVLNSYEHFVDPGGADHLAYCSDFRMSLAEQREFGLDRLVWALQQWKERQPNIDRTHGVFLARLYFPDEDHSVLRLHYRLVPGAVTALVSQPFRIQKDTPGSYTGGLLHTAFFKIADEHLDLGPSDVLAGIQRWKDSRDDIDTSRPTEIRRCKDPNKSYTIFEFVYFEKPAATWPHADTPVSEPVMKYRLRWKGDDKMTRLERVAAELEEDPYVESNNAEYKETIAQTRDWMRRAEWDRELAKPKLTLFGPDMSGDDL